MFLDSSWPGPLVISLGSSGPIALVQDQHSHGLQRPATSARPAARGPGTRDIVDGVDGLGWSGLVLLGYPVLEV